MALLDVVLAYEETLIVAPAGAVREQHGQTLTLDGVLDVSEPLCAQNVAFAQQPLAVGLYVFTEARIGKCCENNQPNRHNNGQKHRITKACPDHTGAPSPHG